MIVSSRVLWWTPKKKKNVKQIWSEQQQQNTQNGWKKMFCSFQFVAKLHFDWLRICGEKKRWHLLLCAHTLFAIIFYMGILSLKSHFRRTSLLTFNASRRCYECFDYIVHLYKCSMHRDLFMVTLFSWWWRPLKLS